jgi:hypothetical protein
MDNFVTLADIGIFMTFIIIITATVQMLKTIVDAITTKLFKITFDTNYLVFVVAFVMYLILNVIKGAVINQELFFVVYCNAIMIAFSSVGAYTVLNKNKDKTDTVPNTTTTITDTTIETPADDNEKDI